MQERHLSTRPSHPVPSHPVRADERNRPTLVSLVPGGTITYENRNLGGRAATVAASINTKSFLAPSDDISYRLMYQKPFIWGLSDENRTKLQATVFNARKLCGVFTPGTCGGGVFCGWLGSKINAGQVCHSRLPAKSALPAALRSGSSQPWP